MKKRKSGAEGEEGSKEYFKEDSIKRVKGNEEDDDEAAAVLPDFIAFSNEEEKEEEEAPNEEEKEDNPGSKDDIASIIYGDGIEDKVLTNQKKTIKENNNNDDWEWHCGILREQALYAFNYFDAGGLGYIFTEDLQVLIESLGLHLHHGFVKELCHAAAKASSSPQRNNNKSKSGAGGGGGEAEKVDYRKLCCGTKDIRNTQ
jgi:hypothetical protein